MCRQGHIEKKRKLLQQVKDRGDDKRGEDKIADLLTGRNVW